MKSYPLHNPKSIILADDDSDDCALFEDALREICNDSNLSIANDGIELMTLLEKTVPPSPDVIFLDLNMPRKNGFECLQEIRRDEKLKDIPVVIFSTSSHPEMVEQVFNQGANFYVCKPGNFQLLKKVIQIMLNMDWNANERTKGNFVVEL